MFNEIPNVLLWLKYKNKTINGILYQTSYLRNYTAKTIKIENYLMKKLFLNIFYWNNYYFNLFRRLEPFIIPVLLENFNFQQKTINFEPEFYLLDGNTIIKGLTIAKDLLLIEFNDYQTLISVDKPLSEDLTIYQQKGTNGYVSYSLELLNDYSIEDLKTIFGSISNGLALLKKILLKENKREEETFRKHFTFSKLTEKVLNKIYFNEEKTIKFNDLVNKPYWALFGSAGSGKSYLLFHLLLNVIISQHYERIYVFDTQKLFNEYVNKLKLNYFNKINKIKEQKGIFCINELNLYLSETEIVNGLNLLLEEKGLITGEEKRKATNIEIQGKTINEIKKDIKQSINYLKNKKDYKSLSLLNLLNDVLLFLKVVKVSNTSIFENEKFFNSIFVFQFEKPFFYSFISYLLFNELENILYNRKQKETFLFLDETQKYLESNLILEKLTKLMAEKRQYGFRLFYTSLTYKDTSELYKLTTNLIFNDLNDVFLRNLLLNKGIEFSLIKPKEKIITDTAFSAVEKVVFQPFLF